MSPPTMMPAANESTPLIVTNKSTATPVPDEENGIPSHHDNSSSDAKPNIQSPTATAPLEESTETAAPSRTSRRGQTDAATNPTWSEAFQLISPYLLPSDRKHALLALSSLLFVLLEKLVNILPPLAIRHAVDAISSFSSSSDATSPSLQHSTSLTITLSILTYFLLTSLTSLLSSLQTISQRTVSLRSELLFSTALFSHLHLLGPSYHLERHAGELLRVLSRGSDAISTIIDALCFNLFPTLFEAAVVGTVFWKLLGIPSIAFSTVGAVVCYLAYTLRMTNVRIGQRRKVLEKSEEVGRIETETLVNYETVVMFGREEREVEEYRGVRGEYLGERVNMLGLFAWLQLGQQTIRLAGTCLGLYLAGRATIYGTDSHNNDDADPTHATTKSTLSPGSFVIVQLYIQQLFQPLSLLGFTYRQVSEAFTDLEKAVKMLKSEPAVKDAEDAVDWDVALKKMQRKHDKNETDALVHSHMGMDNGDSSRNNGENDNEHEASTAGDIVFDNVSFRYKVKSHRKTLGGPDTIENGNSRGRRGRGGIARKGMWGNRGRGVWSGNGGANFWLRDASSKTSSNKNKKDNDDNTTSEDEESIEKMGGIQNVSFHIPAGKVAALVGKSGSGKTTIVRLILRMYDPDEGSVCVDGIDVKSLKQQSLRSNIGVVAQDTVLFHASLRDNITYGKEDATEEEIWEAVRITALEPLVKSLPDGLDTLVGERGMKLSGGERQRVGLARCIIKQPKICLLDEATSALDSGTEREIQKNILTQQTAAAVVKGRTTLMIAHRLSTARRADVILVLEKGRVVERGTHDELLSLGVEKGMYAKMWRDQMGGDSLDEL